MTELRTLTTGLNMGESPRWHDGRLWLANWFAGEVLVVNADGSREVACRVPSPVFSIDWLPSGELLVTSGRTLLRAQPDGSLGAYADLSNVFTGANELVVDGRGNAYLNSPGFDLLAGEAPKPGSVAVVRADGTVDRVAEDLQFPNGMVVTADNSTLIVAESYAKQLTAFTIEADGSLSNRRVWADLGDGVPDGLCLDTEGAVWYADVPNKWCRRVREGGEVLATVQADVGCFACMLSGADGKSLYVVAAEWRGLANAGSGGSGRVLVTDAPAPKAGWP